MPSALRRVVFLLSSLSVIATAPVSARDSDQAEKPKAGAHAKERGDASKSMAAVVAPGALKWAPAAGLPAGSMVAVLDGDPSQPGPFVVRIKFPDGTVVAPHVHPALERVTILSGTMELGGAAGSKPQRLPAGGFFVMPAGVVHGGKAHGETIIEIHATGPWDITYEDPAQDPRGSKG